MAMQNYMQDLMRAQKASEICIVHDASVAALPDEDPFLGSRSSLGDDSQIAQASHLHDDSSSQEFSGPFYIHNENTGPTSSPSSLIGFRERRRKLKEALSPIKVYKWSPAQESTVSLRTPTQVFSSFSGERKSSQRRVNSLRSRLTRLASDSSLLDGPNVV